MKRIISTQEFDTARPRVSLDGTWQFSYDLDEVGEGEGWFAPGVRLPERIRIPGCAQTRRYRSASPPEKKDDVRGALNEADEGDVVEKATVEDRRTVLMKHPYLHTSWHKRTFSIPSALRGGDVWLHVGGVKPAAEVWINGYGIGGTASSRTPVRCELTRHLKLEGKNTLALKVHWPRLRLEGMFDVLCAWSGIYRSVWVEAVPNPHLADIHVITSVGPPRASVKCAVRGKQMRGKPIRVVCEIEGKTSGEFFSGECACTMQGPAQEVSLDIDMPGAGLWSPASPHLYTATVHLFAGDDLADTGSVRFGLREIRVDGFKVLLNGKPIFLRGGCDDQLYPESVCPPASRAFFTDRIRKAKKYGFNYTKSCCEVFIKEFLDAADETGYLVCQEMPTGLFDKRFRDDLPTPYAEFYRQEYENIVVSDRNHPCVVLYSSASELILSRESRRSFKLFNQEMPRMARRLNPNALAFDVTSASSYEVNEVSLDTGLGRRSTDLMEASLRGEKGQFRLCPLTGPISGLEEVTLPFILHEWCWWTSLPDPAVRERYKDLPVKLVGIPEMLKAAWKNGLIAHIPQFVENSRKLKYHLRKGEKRRSGLIVTDLDFVSASYPWFQRISRGSSISQETRLLITGSLNERVFEYLSQGGRVILFSKGVLKESEGDLYRTVPYNRGDRGNMGTVIRPHPALGDFPHEGWCDLPFAPLIQGIYPMDLSAFGPGRIDPIIRSIGHYLTMEDKAYMFEIGVGGGALLACSLKLDSTHRSSPAARYLVDRMISYATGKRFQPEYTIKLRRPRKAVVRCGRT